MSELPPDLLAALERTKLHRPEAAGLIERLLRKRAEASSAEERSSIDRTLLEITRPRRKGIFLALFILCVMVLVLGASYALDSARARRVASAEPARARLLRVGEGFCWFGTKKTDCVELELMVHPSSGAPFPAKVTDNIPRIHLPRLVPNSWLWIAIERSAEITILIDQERLGEVPPEPQ